MVSDPERGTQNLFRRDMLLADHVKQQAEKHGFQLCIIDGTRSIAEYGRFYRTTLHVI